MITAKLTYRISRHEDIPQMLDIWEKFSGWGYISEEDFLKWYVNTPYGESLIIVTTDEETGRLLGQLMLIPSQLRVGQQTVKGYRLFAPVIHDDIRGMDIRDMNHPAFSMFRFSMSIVKERGYSILYSFPSIGWIPVFRRLAQFGIPDVTTATFRCAGIPFTRENFSDRLFAKRYNLVRTKIFTEEFDQLWGQAVAGLPVECGVIRSKERLSYKLTSHYVLEGRDEKNVLIGYIAFRKINGLVVDALAKSREELKYLMHDAVRYISELKQEGQNPLGNNSEIKCICFPYLEEILDTIEHKEIPFDFAFACCLIDEKVPPEAAKADKWWMMPDD
jgi:hypothetical protein